MHTFFITLMIDCESKLVGYNFLSQIKMQAFIIVYLDKNFANS